MSDMLVRRAYASGLSGDQWALVERELPPASGGGRHRTVNLRESVNAIFYRLRTECSWELPPHDFPLAASLVIEPPCMHRLGLLPVIASAEAWQNSSAPEAQCWPGLKKCLSDW